MEFQATPINQGTITSASGVLAGATYAGMKTYAEDKLDLGLILFSPGSTCAGVFTTNLVKSGSVVLTQKRVYEGNPRAVVVHSGIANAVVGEQGIKDAEETTRLGAEHIGLNPEEVLICSTGIIGVELPMALIRSNIGKIELSDIDGNNVAKAILTTDTSTKEIAIEIKFDNIRETPDIVIGGIAKGSGMINPNMATMLAVLSTDAKIEKGFLQESLNQAVHTSFNAITIDGDTSTNDTVLIFATGATGGDPITAEDPRSQGFIKGLETVSTSTQAGLTSATAVSKAVRSHGSAN